MDPGALTGLMKLVQPIIGAVGAGGGLWNNIQNAEYQNKLRGLAMNPAKMMAYAKGFEQPLQAGLLKGTENAVQGYAAERGLATSPQIQQSLMAEAIAPALQQQQNQGLNAAYASLGLGGGAPPGGAYSDLSSSLRMLQSGFPGQAGSPATAPQYDYSPWYDTTTSSVPGSSDYVPYQQAFVNPEGASPYGPYQSPPTDLTSFGFGPNYAEGQ